MQLIILRQGSRCNSLFLDKKVAGNYHSKTSKPLQLINNIQGSAVAHLFLDKETVTANFSWT